MERTALLFDGVGRQFVDRKPDCLRGFRCRTTSGRQAQVAALNGKKAQGVADEPQKGPPPIVRMSSPWRSGETLQAPAEPALEILH